VSPPLLVASAPAQAPAPSIGARLLWSLVAGSLAGGLFVTAAVWLAVAHEVNELLDDSLQSAAQMLAGGLVDAAAAPAPVAPPVPAAAPAQASDRFAWQLVSPEGQVLRRSAQAPQQAWWPVSRAGFSDVPGWRLYGLPTGQGGQTLYAAQSRSERREARAEAAVTTALAGLAVVGLGHVWLRRRLRLELHPLRALSAELAATPVPSGAAPPRPLGRASRQELQPMHDAIDGLTQRLHQRLLAERAFAGHAAHALRTPLAGIDAQLAVALREATPALGARLSRVRDAATRLQGVVAALLALFRSAGGVSLQTVDAGALIARLPAAGLSVRREPAQAGSLVLPADEDLLAAALVNLLDNAVRHGAKSLLLTMPRPGVLRLHDDGPGVAPERREQLRAALAESLAGAVDTAAGSSVLGLGLALAARVAQAHGGRIVLPDSDAGFVVELELVP
jgi:signal transduction histidine kinase